MGITGIWQWAMLILAIKVLILFARPGKISGIMGDFGKGLRNFKAGMKDEDAGDGDDVEVIEILRRGGQAGAQESTSQESFGQEEGRQESSEEKGCEKKTRA